MLAPQVDHGAIDHCRTSQSQRRSARSLRRPTGVFRPYAGVGPSIVFVDFNDSQSAVNWLGAGNTSSVTFGVNFLVGTRIMFGNTLGVFAEYKRNWAIFDQGRSDLHTNAAVGGLVWDFDYFALP